jgi:hypothetical protein
VIKVGGKFGGLDFCQGDSFSEQSTGKVSGEMFCSDFAGVIVHEEIVKLAMLS